MSAEVRDFDTAQHEAAHVVVGVALGLRLRAVVVAWHWDGSECYDGYTLFLGQKRPDARRREAFALMFAAGIAWDRSVLSPRDAEFSSRADRACLYELVSGRHGLETTVRAAAAMLAGLGPIHARITRALLERDLSGTDLAALARGEALDD